MMKRTPTSSKDAPGQRNSEWFQIPEATQKVTGESGEIERLCTSEGFYPGPCHMRPLFKKAQCYPPKCPLGLLFSTVIRFEQASINNVLLIFQLTVPCLQEEAQKAYVCSSLQSVCFIPLIMSSISINAN